MVELIEFIKEGDEAQEKVCPVSHVMFRCRSRDSKRGVHNQRYACIAFNIRHAHRQFSRGFSKSGMVTQLK